MRPTGVGAPGLAHPVGGSVLNRRTGWNSGLPQHVGKRAHQTKGSVLKRRTGWVCRAKRAHRPRGSVLKRRTGWISGSAPHAKNGPTRTG
ncbi:hypothetical protein PV779_17210 [Streptomyces sp. ID01-9D]|nr:hypothetical protein [Streptomyces sp. ID01-9D]